MPYGNVMFNGYGKRGGALAPDFSADVVEGNAPLTVAFTNLTQGNNDYIWDFDDGTISREKNPTHTFNSVGVYTISLMAQNGGSSGYIIKYNFILAIPATSPPATIAPYSGISGGYGVGNDNGTNVAYTQATSGANEGRIRRAISSITGRWDFNFRLMNNNPQFVQYCFLSSSSTNPFPGYAMVADGANHLFKLVKINSSGVDTTLLSTSFNTAMLENHTMSVTRNSNGLFEFFVDGISIGTVTDTTYTSFSYDWIREWSGASTSQALYNWIKKDGAYVQNWNSGISNLKRLYAAPIIREPGKNMGHPRLIEIDNELRLYYQKHGGVGICYAVMNKDLAKFDFSNGGNPVFNWEDAGVPEGSTGMRMGNILKVGNLYYLYYGSEPASNIYLATSSDGINFTPHPSNPVATPAGGSEPMMGLPFVIKVDDTFYMYYLNFDGVYTQPFQYRVASSSDGISWTKHGVIVDKGSSGAWDGTLLEDKSVFYDGINFYLLYEGYNGVSWCAGLAKSSNPLGPFTKNASPILSGTGVDGTYDEYHIATPYIYQVDDKIFLVYQGGNTQDYNNSEFSFMLATIDDLNSL